MNNDFNVAWCPFCNQGWVQIVKDSSNGKLALLCQECDTVWANPEDLQLNEPFRYLFQGMAIKPSFDEILNVEWDRYIINEKG
jgi:hypothetical protein